MAAQNAVRASVEAWAAKARDVLRPHLGNTWSEAWVAVGFKFNTLSLPTSLADLVELTCGFKNYFTANPARQNARVSATAAAADQFLTSLETAVQTVANCKRDQRQKREARDAAEGTLLKLMRKTHSELEATLEPDDTRWLDFEDSIPSDPSVPEAVSGVQAEGDGPGAVVVEWLPSLRAQRYFVEILETGKEVEFRRVATVLEPDADLEGLTPGGRYKVRVIAGNSAGESAPSGIVDVAVPSLAAVA